MARNANEMFGPLTFQDHKTNHFVEEISTKCLLCDKKYMLKSQIDFFCKHIFEEHSLVIEDVQNIESLYDYVNYWANRLKTCKLEQIVPNIHVQETNSKYYLLSKLLQEDKELRHQIKLKHVVKVQEFERTDKNYKRNCLLCKLEFEGTRTDYLNHLSKKHNLQLGNPQNLVFIDELIEYVNEKLDENICLFCEKPIPDRKKLKEHMRKKIHKRLNPRNKEYDKYYIINYLEAGKNWEAIQEEDDRYAEPRGYEHNNDDEYRDWEEREDEINCLFCDFKETNIYKLCVHMAEVHEFDFVQTTKDYDFYQKIKLVNYVRRQIHNKKCPFCDQVFDNVYQHVQNEKHCKVADLKMFDQPDNLKVIKPPQSVCVKIEEIEKSEESDVDSEVEEGEISDDDNEEQKVPKIEENKENICKLIGCSDEVEVLALYDLFLFDGFWKPPKKIKVKRKPIKIQKNKMPIKNEEEDFDKIIEKTLAKIMKKKAKESGKTEGGKSDRKSSKRLRTTDDKKVKSKRRKTRSDCVETENSVYSIDIVPYEPDFTSQPDKIAPDTPLCNAPPTCSLNNLSKSSVGDTPPTCLSESSVGDTPPTCLSENIVGGTNSNVKLENFSKIYHNMNSNCYEDIDNVNISNDSSDSNEKLENFPENLFDNIDTNFIYEDNLDDSDDEHKLVIKEEMEDLRFDPQEVLKQLGDLKKIDISSQVTKLLSSQATPESDQATPKNFQVTPKPDQTTSKTDQATPKTDQGTPHCLPNAHMKTETTPTSQIAPNIDDTKLEKCDSLSETTWKIYLVEIPNPDYSRLKINKEEAKISKDPRLIRIFKICDEATGIQEQEKNEILPARKKKRVDPRLRKKEKEQILAINREDSRLPNNEDCSKIHEKEQILTVKKSKRVDPRLRNRQTVMP